MRIITIPCLKDNYAYLIICEETQDAAIVDPSEAGPVMKVLSEEGVQLKAILNTHHHWDHTGGNEGLTQSMPDLRVYGYHTDQGRISGQTHFLHNEEHIQIGHLDAQVIFNPGHTLGAVSYWFKNEKALFTGDTLFAAGCGRTFEGTAEQMYHSLNYEIGQVPDDTQIFFGHEYTCNNLAFALTVESENSAISERLESCRQRRNAHEMTTPSLMAEERATNPFLRCQVKEIMASVKKHESQNDLQPASVFRVLRALKDQF